MTTRKKPLAHGHLDSLGSFPIPHIGDRRVRLYKSAVKDPTRARPVLILFDGQNAFGDEGSFAGGWHAHRAADKLVPKRVCIAPWLVAVDHGHERRIDELGPWSAGSHGGLTPHLADWLADFLVPYLRSRVPILEGSLGAVLGGSSMGGLAALWTHFARPDAFGGAISMSPSLWFGGRRIFRDLRERSTPQFSRIYMDCGVNEGRGAMHPIVESMAVELASRAYPMRQLKFVSDRRGTHSERAWKRRMPAALEFMFRHVP
jgi:predicted alpha/beta superfamily hydrolase